MSFIDVIKECFLGLDIEKPSYRICVLGESAGYFENIVGIKNFSPEEISLYIKRGTIVIKGNNLYIKKLYEKDVAIAGKITSVEIL